MVWSEFYRSPAQQPYLLWAPTAIFLSWFLTRRPRVASPFLHAWLLFFSVTSLLDAWLTADQVLGLGALPKWAASFVPMLFVILGDYRWYLLIERFSGARRPFLSALALSLIVPILSKSFYSLSGSAEIRVLFLAYEVMFLVLATIYQRYVLSSRKHPPELRSVVVWAQLYYGLWATADIGILFGAPYGATEGSWALRVVANVLYYGGLVPFAYLKLKGAKSNVPTRA